MLFNERMVGFNECFAALYENQVSVSSFAPTHSPRSLVMGLTLQSLYSQHLLEPAGGISVFPSSRMRMRETQKQSLEVDMLPEKLKLDFLGPKSARPHQDG